MVAPARRAARGHPEKAGRRGRQAVDERQGIRLRLEALPPNHAVHEVVELIGRERGEASRGEDGPVEGEGERGHLWVISAQSQGACALARAKIYCDSFETTLDHIGEFKIPLSSGALARRDVLADFYARGDGKSIMVKVLAD